MVEMIDLAGLPFNHPIGEYTTAIEAACRCHECINQHDKVVVQGQIALTLIRCADLIRSEWGRRWTTKDHKEIIRWNSGNRCAAHNKKIKGSPTSGHLNGFAADWDLWFSGTPIHRSQERLWTVTQDILPVFPLIRRLEVGILYDHNGVIRPKHVHADLLEKDKKTVNMLWIRPSK